MKRAAIVGLTLLSTSVAADEVLKRHLDTVLNFVGTMNANCALSYEESMTAKARAALNFSRGEIIAYCVCSTQLLIREMDESDFKNLAKGGELPMRFADPLKNARFECARKVWDARKRR